MWHKPSQAKNKPFAPPQPKDSNGAALNLGDTVELLAKFRWDSEGTPAKMITSLCMIVR